MRKAAIFGGLGFIGGHMVQHIYKVFREVSIVLFDVCSYEALDSYRRTIIDAAKCKIVFCDVRQPIVYFENDNFDIIFNLAAIHREPGHEHREYFETNIFGAQNVTQWASEVSCQSIIFSSSIAPYGTLNTSVKDEDTLACPDSAYGSSKLVAEHIHRTWCSYDTDRSLLIIRPGVVYGPTEGGNVTRLITMLKYRVAIYAGNKDVQKAGIYIKELCNATLWLLEWSKLSKMKVTLANLSYWECPTLQDYAKAIDSVRGNKSIPISVPYRLLLFMSYLIYPISLVSGILKSVHPMRIEKLRRGNYIKPSLLLNEGYLWKYSFEDSFEDWKKSRIEEWN